jgi:hypothetical protein
MKNIIVLITLVVSINANASHFMGGIIQVAQKSQDSVSIGMYIVGDQFPILPQYVTLEIWEMDSQGSYDLGGYITLTKFNNGTHQGFNTANYGSDYINLDSNKYRFIYTNCCWSVLNNSTNSTNSEFVISTDYWHVPNNTTPYMENPMWINVQSNSVNVMKPVWGIFNCYFGHDDNDSVNLYMTELYSSYSNGVFVPQTQTSTNISANNDSITFVGTTLGRVGYGFQIDKYRSGYLLTSQRIQWTFVVTQTTLDIEENIGYRDMEYKVYDWSGRYMGSDIKTLNGGLYVVRYSNGKMEKINVLLR